MGENDQRFLALSLLKSLRGRRMDAADCSDFAGFGLGFSEEELSENLKGVRNLFC